MSDRCPTCAQRAKPRAKPTVESDETARLWASYLLYLLSRYTMDFKKKVLELTVEHLE